VRRPQDDRTIAEIRFDPDLAALLRRLQVSFRLGERDGVLNQLTWMLLALIIGVFASAYRRLGFKRRSIRRWGFRRILG
jgi:hypothetical protein